MPAASFERNGFQTRYSTFSAGSSGFELATSTLMRFSP